MSDEMMKQILSRLDVLAAKLGVAAQYLWIVLLHQAYVTAYMDVAWAVVGALIVVVAMISARRAWRYCQAGKDPYGDMPIEGSLCVIVSLGACVVGVLICLLCASEAATILLNPPYWALRELLK
jgi:hypothetical protein